jgi:hypothetical protein
MAGRPGLSRMNWRLGISWGFIAGAPGWAGAEGGPTSGWRAGARACAELGLGLTVLPVAAPSCSPDPSGRGHFTYKVRLALLGIVPAFAAGAAAALARLRYFNVVVANKFRWGHSLGTHRLVDAHGGGTRGCVGKDHYRQVSAEPGNKLSLVPTRNLGWKRRAIV